MEVRNFFLLGRTDHNAIVARLREVLTRWQDEWCVESSVPEVEVIPEDLRGPPLPGCEWRTGTAIGEVKAAVGLTVRASDSLLSALIHSSLRPITNHLKPVGVEAELKTGAIDALISILLEEWDSRELSIKWDSQNLEGGILDSREGFVVARCRWQATEMLIVLYPGLTDRYIRRSSKETVRFRKQVTPFRNALAAQSLTMQICAGAAELTLKELHDLAVGDVIILDRRLNEPLTIQIADSADWATGHLGVKAGRKAVQLAIPSDNDGVESNG